MVEGHCFVTPLPKADLELEMYELEAKKVVFITQNFRLVESLIGKEIDLA